MDKIIDLGPPVPTFARAGVTPGWDRLRIVDAKSGQPIERVVEVHTDVGLVIRMDLDAAGNLQIVDDRLKTVEEHRKVRLEWIGDPEAPAPAIDVEAAVSTGEVVA